MLHNNEQLIKKIKDILNLKEHKTYYFSEEDIEKGFEYSKKLEETLKTKKIYFQLDELNESHIGKYLILIKKDNFDKRLSGFCIDYDVESGHIKIKYGISGNEKYLTPKIKNYIILETFK